MHGSRYDGDIHYYSKEKEKEKRKIMKKLTVARVWDGVSGFYDIFTFERKRKNERKKIGIYFCLLFF